MTKTIYRPSPDAILNPRLDANFKAIFTSNSPNSKIALKSFLEAVLDAKVSDIALVPTEAAIESETDKQSIFDITCILNGSEPVNIEMQGINRYSNFGNRAEYYAAHLLNHYTPKGTEESMIPKVFQISVLDFIFDDTTQKFFSFYKMQTDDGRHLSDRLNVIFLELPKLSGNDDKIDGLTTAEKWCKFLLYADKKEKSEYVDALCKSEGGLMAAQSVLLEISQDDIKWCHQTSIDKFQRDYKTGLYNARQEGISQGISQGDHHARIETARKMLAGGLSIEQICAFTDLPQNEIKSII